MNPDDQNLDQIDLDSDVPVTYEQQPEDYYEEETKLNPLIIIYSGLYFFLLLIAIFLSIKSLMTPATLPAISSSSFILLIFLYVNWFVYFSGYNTHSPSSVFLNT